MKIKLKAILFSFLAVVLLATVALLLSSKVEKTSPGVTEIRLARCDLELYDRSAQPVATAVLACPGVDAVRLWPLPVLQPWYERPLPAPGQQSKTGTKVNKG